MRSLGKLKTSSVVGLLLLVIGLVSGVYLVGLPQELRENAATMEENIFTEDFESLTNLNDWLITKGTSSAGSATIVQSENNVNPHSGNKMLKIAHNQSYIQVDRALPASNRTLVSFSGYFWDPGATVNRGFQLRVSNSQTEFILGVNSFYFSNDNYFIRPGNSGVNFMDTGIPRSGGWHKFEIRVTPIGTYGLIDNKNLSYLPAINGVGPVNHALTIAERFGTAVTWNEPGNYYFDYFKLDTLDNFTSVQETSLTLINKYLNGNPEKYLTNFFELTLDPASGKYLYMISGTDGFNKSRFFANYTLAKAFECRFINSFANNCADEVSIMIHSLIKIENYSQWRGTNLNSGSSFLYSNSPLIMYPTSLASWFIWDRIPHTEEYPLRQRLTTIITEEANFWSAHPEEIRIPDATIGNTNTEVYAWTSAFLTLAGNMFENSTWLGKGEYMSNQVLNNSNSGAPSGENPYKIYNHGIFHPGYFIYSLASLSEGLLSHKLTENVYSSVINNAELDRFFNANLSSSILNYSDYRYVHQTYSGKWGYKDDWFRAPETNALSAFTLLKNIDQQKYTNNNLGRYNHHTNLETFLPMNVVASELNIPIDIPYDVTGNQFRSIIESISPLYNVVTYLWESGVTFLPVTQVPPTPTPTNTPLPTPTNTPTNTPTPTVTSTPTSTPTPTSTATNTPVPTNTPTPTAIPILGDLNGDGKVDIFDFNELVQHYGWSGNPGDIPADIDKDGDVDIFDFNIVITNFTG